MMATIRRFEDLEVWKKARELTALVYQKTASVSFNQDFRLRSQMRDAAVSIMSNIAEGFSRNSDREFVQFLYFSRGSAAELQSQFYVALDQNYVDRNTFDLISERADHTSRMLANLIKYLRTQRTDAKTQDASTHMRL